MIRNIILEIANTKGRRQRLARDYSFWKEVDLEAALQLIDFGHDVDDVRLDLSALRPVST